MNRFYCIAQIASCLAMTYAACFMKQNPYSVLLCAVVPVWFKKSAIIARNLDGSDTTGDEKRDGRWLPKEKTLAPTACDITGRNQKEKPASGNACRLFYSSLSK